MRKEEIEMKKFEIPEIEVRKFAIEDVITTSGDPLPTEDSDDWGAGEF